MGETANRLASQDEAPTRRRRSTPEEMRSFYDALVAIVGEIKPCTVRQVFYQAVVRGLVDKIESEYDRVQIALVRLRETEEIPWTSIVDSTRWVRRVKTWATPKEAIEEAARFYRKSVWTKATVVPEVWLEKDALAGVVFDETSEWGVDLFSARGYCALPFAYQAAQAIAERFAHDQRSAIYHLGDFDPSGRDAARSIRSRLTQFTVNAGCTFTVFTREEGRFEGSTEMIGHYRSAEDPAAYRVTEEDIEELQIICDAFTFTELAVTPEQIEKWDLPLRATKKLDTRKASFEAKYGTGGSVELDAIHPDDLRALVREAISQHIDPHELHVLRVIEKSERMDFLRAARGYDPDDPDDAASEVA